MKQKTITKAWIIFAIVSLLVASLVVLIPFMWMVNTALQPNIKSVYQIPPRLPNPIAWGNFIKAWKSAPFGIYLKNSIIVSVAVVLLQTVTSAMAAYAFSWIKFPGRNVLFLFFLAVLMIPRQVTVIPQYIIISDLGWIDTLTALTIPLAVSAFGTFLIRQSFLSVPGELVDAALIDGAGHFMIMSKIMIPLNQPMILTFLLLSFNWTWNDYFWPLIMTNSTNMRTLPVGLVQMRMGPDQGTEWQIIMAATVFVLLPVMLIFILFQRQFVEGVARQGIKG